MNHTAEALGPVTLLYVGKSWTHSLPNSLNAT